MTTATTHSAKQTQVCTWCHGAGRGYFDFDVDAEVDCKHCAGTGKVATAVSAKPRQDGASEKQIAFAEKLVAEMIERTVEGARLAGTPLSDQDVEGMTIALGEAVTKSFESKRSASQMIDSLIDSNQRLRRANAERAQAIRQAEQATRRTERAQGHRDATDVDGMYQLPDGRIVKVQYAVHGSGKPYAKLLVKLDEPVIKRGKQVTWGFEYAPGLVRECTPERKMSLEDAKAWGALYGACCNCGATLTDETSIEAGIGPICSGRFA